VLRLTIKRTEAFITAVVVVLPGNRQPGGDVTFGGTILPLLGHPGWLRGRKRFLEQRLDGLMQERHPGQKPAFRHEEV